MINEYYGPKAAKNTVYIGLAMSILVRESFDSKLQVAYLKLESEVIELIVFNLILFIDLI